MRYSNCRRSAGSTTGRLALLFMGAVAALAFTPIPAAASPSLQGADPAAGSALDAMPTSLVLRFDDTVSAPDSHVAVIAANGQEVTGGETEQPSPGELSVRLSPGYAGDVTVAYHVIFMDGASVTGAFRFSVGTGVAPAPLSAAAQESVTASVAEHQHEVDPASAVLLVIDGAVLAVVVFLLWARPRAGAGTPRRAWTYRGGGSP